MEHNEGGHDFPDKHGLWDADEGILSERFITSGQKSMIRHLGARRLPDGSTQFLVWAPRRKALEVSLLDPSARHIPMRKRADGYFEAEVAHVVTGTRYLYVLDGLMERADPASHFQPEGVHGPSCVVDHGAFAWDDGGWTGLPLENYVLYETHVGTFTHEGTFDALAGRIPYLKDLGITAVELMPVAQFPGTRNWGYDGVYPFAVQQSYGGPDGLKRLVNVCHQAGLAVVLDVVYNHLGPEGNYLRDFAPYFTDRYVTPWGEAVNFDGPYSDGVRRYVIENALHWLSTYHLDALRIDAVHGIFDVSPTHILRELKQAVSEHITDRHVYLIAESDLNDVRLVGSPHEGGYGLDAQWNDDFHHALHTLLTGEQDGYYVDFGRLEHMAKALSEGFVYSGQYSEFRKRRHGSSTRSRPPTELVVFSQNHDQVGNRARGDRLSQSLDASRLKLAAALVVLTPGIPLLFMGEEYAETAPFQYFVSHSDPALVDAVRKGRREEFARFQWGDCPDPQDEATLERSRLSLGLRRTGHHREVFDFYRHVIALRKQFSSFLTVSRKDIHVSVLTEERIIVMRLHRLLLVASFSPETVEVPLEEHESWSLLLDGTSAGSAGDASGIMNHFLRLPPYGFSFFTRED